MQFKCNDIGKALRVCSAGHTLYTLVTTTTIIMITSQNISKQFIRVIKWVIKTKEKGFPGGAVVENPPANAGDTGSSPGLGGSHMPRSN